MINFEKLVGLILSENNGSSGLVDAYNQPIQSSTPTPDSQTPSTTNTQTPADQIEEQTANDVNGFLKEKYSDLSTKLKTVFAKYYESQAGNFPDQTTFEKLIYTVTKNSLRDTENIGSFENDIPSLYPLIDLIALCKQAYVDTKGNPDAKIKAIEAVYKNFLTRLDSFKTTNKIMPLEFSSISPWANNVKNRYFEKQGKLDIGKLKLENPELQNKSIYDAIMTLLEHRRTSKIKLFKKELNIGSAVKDIEKILFNPDDFITGQISFPDKKINLLYAGATPELLLSVAKNAKNLFEQQIKEKQITKEELIPELYQNFLKNKTSMTFGITERFKSQYKDNHRAQQIISNVEKSSEATAGSNYKESFSTNISNLLEKLTAQQYKQQLKTASFPKGFYTVKDLQTYSKTVPQADQLYKSLKALADHIKTEAQQIDWAGVLGGAAQLAKGLSLGVPTMGR